MASVMHPQLEVDGESTTVSRVARAGWALDLIVATVLFAVAFQLRRRALPAHGLWLDDSVEAAAAKMTSLRQVFTVGEDHPGFIVVLKFVRALGVRSDAGLAYPALVAGTITPSLLFLALRRFGFARSISALLGAALTVTQIDVIYSGRVKTHVIDPLIILGLVVVVPALTRKRWGVITALGWVCAAFLLATVSGYALLTVTVAAVVIASHPVGDFVVRIIAVGAQAVVSAALFLAESGTYNRGVLQAQWRHVWDAFPSASPQSVLVHLGRVAETFPGGPLWIATVTVIVAIVALVVEATRSEHAVLARFLLLMLVVAAAAGVMGAVPFGPKTARAVAGGTRVTLWLAPVVAVGVAFALQRVLELAAARVRAATHIAAYVGAAVVLFSAVTAVPWRYPLPDANKAAQFVESNVGPRDAVVVAINDDSYSLAAESTFRATLTRTPQSGIGFWPSYTDPRIVLTYGRSALYVAIRVSRADRVFVYRPRPPFNAVQKQSLQSLAVALSYAGFVLQENMQWDRARLGARVEVWHRANMPSAR